MSSVGENLDKHSHAKLGEWSATAICGNDITSSCLYVTALALLWAGPLAPVSLLLVALVLWLFRGIYAEVVGALPLNGGAYNALLNTTSKFRASLAACLTILSYLATAVISGSEAIHYIFGAFHSLTGKHLSHDLILVATIVLLLCFAFLTIKGIGESAKVALGIFIFHLSTLGLLIGCSAFYVFHHGLDLFSLNLQSPAPQLSTHPLFFGFAVSLLGISGFESSSNFVEEQKEGVFPKTLRNMWVAVSVLNLSICTLALSIVPLSDLDQHQTTLLAHMGEISAGKWLGTLISINAAVVLSGAVLTSFVGVTGLVHRMTLDRCLPQFLLKLSRFDTHHRIILSFFFLSALLVILVSGDVATLAGVYTISFLAVMGLFAFGNILLKIKRESLPRETRANWFSVLAAMAAVCVGVIGNIILDWRNVEFFLLYFIPTMLVVSIM
ncbi:MAG: APC family permease, partial [Bdellovibrionales bacterium]|nr:APC family permease [Bdellovibrionales bacterium]